MKSSGTEEREEEMIGGSRRKTKEKEAGSVRSQNKIVKVASFHRSHEMIQLLIREFSRI